MFISRLSEYKKAKLSAKFIAVFANFLAPINDTLGFFFKSFPTSLHHEIDLPVIKRIHSQPSVLLNQYQQVKWS